MGNDCCYCCDCCSNIEEMDMLPGERSDSEAEKRLRNEMHESLSDALFEEWLTIFY